MTKKYLVTGGCGFVGRNLAKRLMDLDGEVWIIDNLFTGRHPDEWFSKKHKKSQLHFIHADAIEIFLDELKGNSKSILPKFDDVYHFASVVGGRELIDGDPILVATDLAIDSLFFLWATRNSKKIKRILYASSSAAYPVKLQTKKESVALKESYLDFDKNKIGVPDMTYGWSKLTGEYLSKFAASKYDMHIACIRPFSGYGEDQEAVYPIPAIANRVARRENPLTVWGDGKQGRDFVYIQDFIDAFFIVLDKINDGSAINIGSGKLTSFLEVLEIFSSIAGYKPEIKKLTNKPVGVAKRYANITKIKKMGWKPKIRNEEGFERVLDFMEGKYK
jgi:UDP-glucose 4-epimerase